MSETMISSSEASKAIGRLSALPWFPKGNDVAQTELADSLRSNARSMDHAGRIIARLLNQPELLKRAPAPLDILTAAEQEPGFNYAPVECSVCGGEGWITHFVLVTWEGKHRRSEFITEEQYIARKKQVKNQIGVQAVYEAADRCECLKAVIGVQPTH